MATQKKCILQSAIPAPAINEACCSLTWAASFRVMPRRIWSFPAPRSAPRSRLTASSWPCVASIRHRHFPQCFTHPHSVSRTRPMQGAALCLAHEPSLGGIAFSLHLMLSPVPLPVARCAASAAEPRSTAFQKTGCARRPLCPALLPPRRPVQLTRAQSRSAFPKPELGDETPPAAGKTPSAKP